jgi:hypothetical protein
MNGLVASAIAVAACFAVPDASAVTLCKEAKNPCPEASRYPSGTAFSASLREKTDLQITTSIGTITCSTSTFAGKTTSTGTAPLTGTVTSMNLFGCHLASSACTFTAINLPYAATFWAIAAVGNGTLRLENGGTGRPSLAMECGTFINCTFGFPTLLVAVTGGNPATGSVNQSLEREGSLCPSTVAWEAEFVLTPKPLFVSAEP